MFRVAGCLALWVMMCGAAFAAPAKAAEEIRIIELQGVVEVSPATGATWVSARTNHVLHPFDKVRTAANSRVAFRWSDSSVLTFGASAELEILPAYSREAQTGLRLVRGIISFFHRDEPGRIHVITRGATAGVEGTEFVMSVAAVNGTERTTLSVIDGQVRFSNEQAMLLLTNGQQAAVEVGKAPTRTAGFIANNVLQWCFYYPGVLDLEDLPLTPEEERALGASLAAYRAGDVLAALAAYPSAVPPASDAERIYYGALLLSVGQIEGVEAQLSSLVDADPSSRSRRLADALRQLIAAVKRQEAPAFSNPQLATEFLASSYYQQSLAGGENSLVTALALARQAAAHSTNFGFAWARVAELEFSFGRTDEALKALNQSLSLAPRNAQALALKGFLLAAQNRTREALAWFDRALAIDGALGNAWLGRGLCRIRTGEAVGGREDLLVAAAMEPQRAELRSYLGKAYGDAGDFKRATTEFRIAEHLDPDDPTAWLYSALLNQQRNRVNQAIRDLEKSQALNDNRGIYRSQLLLDQDRAVRSISLAGIYQDAGMSEVSLREAARAVNSDYANYSAHLFLADSFDPGLDLINRRYETAAAQEFLLANLLAPAGAPTLSSTLSQSEYSRLFERNRVGVVSSTEYLSRGAWTESGAQYGTFEKFSYDVNWLYASDPGERPNNDLELHRLGVQFKTELTSQDSLYGFVSEQKTESGDLFQHYDPSAANPDVRQKEMQKPLAAVGYHREWSPGVHTLLLAAGIKDTLSFINPAQPTLVAFRPDMDPISMPGVTELASVRGITMHEDFESTLEVYSVEMQQIWQQTAHNTIMGARVQFGEFTTATLQKSPSALISIFPDPPTPASQQDLSSSFERTSFYGYHQWDVLERVQLIGGLDYDWIKFPENFRAAPISDEEETRDRVSPKAGLIWTPAGDTTVRFAYTRSLAGAAVDQSLQLEPSQVAGFVQSFRSIIPESVVGANAGATFETCGLSIEQRFQTGTYLSVSGEILNSEVKRTLGAFDMFPDQLDLAIPSRLRNHLDYEERSLVVTANQLLGNQWAFGTRYRLSQAVLENDYVDVPDGLSFIDFQPRQRLDSILHQLDLFAIANHPSGLFARAGATWYAQSNRGYAPDQPGDDFWQFNLVTGYRLLRRKAEIEVGLLNLTDQDYRLSPLNLYNEMPRERTLALRLRLNF